MSRETKVTVLLPGDLQELANLLSVLADQFPHRTETYGYGSRQKVARVEGTENGDGLHVFIAGVYS